MPGYEVVIGSYRFDPIDEEPEPEPGTRDEEAPGPALRRLKPWIVQFHHPPGEGDSARLRSQFGLHLRDHIPQRAYLERLDTQTARQVRADPLTRACVPYRPEFKLSRSIGALTGPDQLIAVLFDDTDTERVAAALEEAGASSVRVSDRRRLGGQARIHFRVADPGQLHSIAQVDDVRRIEPVRKIVEANVAAASTIQGGAPDLSPVWDRELHGEGQIIGVIDDGPPDVEHCFFADASDNAPGPDHRKVLAVRNAAKTPVTGQHPPGVEPPAVAHATFVAGCIAGDDIGAPGEAPRRGGAWAAKLVCGNYHDLNLDDPRTDLFEELVAAAVAHGTPEAPRGALIHNNSWGHEPLPDDVVEPYDLDAYDVDHFTWENEGHLVIGASTNTGEVLGPFRTAKNAICVAAADTHPNHAILCSGVPDPMPDGRRKPELVVVGRVRSAIAQTACDTGLAGCATSWATAHAAAAAVLVRQYFVEGWYPSGKSNAMHARTPSGALLKAVLLNATVPMAGTDFAGEYPTPAEGWGRLQLDRGLFFEGGARKLQLWDTRNAKGLTTGVTRTHRVDVKSSSEPLKVTLVWTEPPGENPDDTEPSEDDPEHPTFPVVNDLDLRVISPGEDGAVYRGNAFLDGESDPTSQFRDTRNNVEMVLVKTPAQGRWTIEVRAIRVQKGNPGQGYALVVTGDVASVCFVGTAVYGDPDHPDVRFLREWRDQRLSPDAPGAAAMRVLVAAYARLGPALARVVGGRPRLAAVLRRFVFARAVAVLRRRESAPEMPGPRRGRRRRRC